MSERRIRGGAFKHPRGRAVAWDGGTTITYEWPCGHRRAHDYARGRASKRVGVAGCRLLFRWHGNADGVNLGPCPTCARNERNNADVVRGRE